MKHERVIVIEGIDERDIPLREVAPSTEMARFAPANDVDHEWAGTGPARGEYEQARIAVTEYLPPGRA
ncbi:MAG TPA: hypothetical protein VHG72_13940 [Polyangia bacterium]|nr:hypothetical protein [Polyangia bacterium]